MLTAPRTRVVGAIGAAQLIAWASSYYLLATVARPMATGLGLPPALIYGAFSAALLLAAAVGPFTGARIDRYGGRAVLLASNFVFAAGLLCLAAAQGAVTMVLGWLLIGVAMPMGLYDAAFSTLVSLYRNDARRSIIGVTLIAGFASSVSWPLSASVEAHHGWRAVCVMWALLHLTVGAAIHALLVPRVAPLALHADSSTPDSPPPPRVTFWTLAGIFAAHGFIFAAIASHLPRILVAAGCTPTAAVAAASLIGIAQVGSRMVEAGFLSRLHPLFSARLSMSLHPLGVLLISGIGAPAATLFAVFHGAGIGIMTIVKGTLPLALFGAQGFGRRAALLEAPSRIIQAFAPLLFGLGVDALGSHVLWISGAIALLGFFGTLSLRRRG